MWIVKTADRDYALSTDRQNAVCQILPPVFVSDGKEIRAAVIKTGADFAEAEGNGLHVSDRIVPAGNGIFKATRTVTNRSGKTARFKSVFEARTCFCPDHYVFPGFLYDASLCKDGVEAGEILNSSKKALKSSVHNTPDGLEIDGKPWVFAYDREGIPAATVSEDEKQVFALFASDEDRASLESSSSMVREADGTFRHRLLHPVSELPYTYAHKNSYEGPYETFFTLKDGESVTHSQYLFAGEPRFPAYGTVALMEACAAVFPFTRTPELTPDQVWDLGIGYFRFLLKDKDGVPMFSGHLCDKLFHRAHSGELSGAALAEALKDPENTKLNTFSLSFEVGWAGQGAMIARLFALNGFRTGNVRDVQIGEKCLDGYVASQQESGLLFPLYGQKDLPPEKRREPDACNMGWAMCEVMRSYRLFREHGIEKKNYRDFAVKLADFAVKTYSPADGFPKTWSIDGTPLSVAGSIGGFMIMGLCEVHRETGDPRYLDTVKKAMDLYYRRDLDHFVCTAGAIDCACIDKETAYPFVEAALYLYDLTGEQLWLERAEKAAGYFFSWLFFYDCLYDENADFTKYGYHTTGGTAISAEHSALDPWGALLVNALFRLWHLTGNRNYLIWAKMTWWNALLCITTESTPEIHGNKRPVGSQNEGFFHCRWTKYRPTCEERGHFNENLQSWMGAYRLYTLSSCAPEDLKLLWEANG